MSNFYELDDFDDDDEPVEWHKPAFTPQEIYNSLTDRGIVGQEAAKRAAAMILYGSQNGRASTSIFCGSTGSGKSAIWQALKDEYGDYISIFDASGITAEGWKGGSINSLLITHLRALQHNHFDTGCGNRLGGIVVLDEFDKLIEPQVGSGGTNYSTMIQGQLLRLFDRSTVTISNDGAKEAAVLDCSGLSLVCCGAFENLLTQKTAKQERPLLGIDRDISKPSKLDYSNTVITTDDLIAAGMRAELAGRIDRIVQLQPLSLQNMVDIGYRELKKLGDVTHAELSAPRTYMETLARDALDRCLGARWIRSRLAISLDEQLFVNPNAYQYTLGLDTPAAE